MDTSDYYNYLVRKTAHEYLGSSYQSEVDNYISYVSAIIYPALHKISKESKLFSLATDLLSHKKDKGKILNQYTFEALRNYFLKYWGNEDEHIKSFYLSKIGIVDKIDNGIVYFKNNVIDTNKILSLPQPPKEIKYGQQSKILEDMNQVTSNDTLRLEMEVPQDLSCFVELSSFWGKAFPNNTFLSPYFWQNSFSLSQFRELKELLKRCVTIDQNKVFNIHALKLAFYVSMWARYEFDGRNNENNALTSINLNSSFERVWNAFNKPEGLLYEAGEDPSNRYRSSLYALGGFPIKYTTRQTDNSFTRLFKKIYYLISHEDVEDEDLPIFDKQAEDILNDQAYNQSLVQENGSLHKYILEILDGNYYFAEEDSNDPQIINFKRLVEQGKNNLPKKFRFEWEVRRLPDMRLFRKLKFCFNTMNGLKWHNYLSYYRLISWNIPTDIKSFDLHIKIIGYSLGKEHNVERIIHYLNNYKKSFVGNLIYNYLTFEDLPENISSVCVYATFGDTTINIYEHIVDQCIQLYETQEAYVWSSQRRRSTGRSAILCPKDWPIVSNDVYQTTECGFSSDKNLQWVDFVGKITINGIKFVCDLDSINLSIRTFPQIIQYQNGDKVKYVCEDEESQIIPVFGRKSIDVFLYPRDKNDDPRKLGKEEFDLYYETAEGQMCLWDETHRPNQGKTIIQAKTELYKSPKVIVYYLPTNPDNKKKHDPIRRNIAGSAIIFSSAINNINIYSTGVEQKGNTFIFANDEEDEALTKEFQIGTPEEYISLDMIIPFEEIQLRRDGKFVKRIQNEKVLIPYILKDRYSIVIINGKGMKEVHDIFTNLKGYHVFEDRWDYTLPYCHEVGENVFSYLYLPQSNQVNQKSETAIDVSGKVKNDYHFFFWSMGLEDDPIEVPLEYEEYTKPNGHKWFRIAFDSIFINGKKGIIFQSLKNATPFKYYSPILVGNIDNWNDPKTIDILTCLIKCFNLAKEHKVPFHVFRPFHLLIESSPKVMTPAEFFVHYSKSKNYLLEKEDMDALIRLADEFMFSWLYLGDSFVNAIKNKEINREKANECRKQLLYYIASQINNLTDSIAYKKLADLPAKLSAEFRFNNSKKTINFTKYNKRNQYLFRDLDSIKKFFRHISETKGFYAQELNRLEQSRNK